MATTTNVLKMRIQLRRATTAEWEQYNTVVPAAGEPCFDTVLGTLKIGDGVKSYGELKAIGGSESISVSADGDSIVLENGVFKLAGFDVAQTGAQPRINAEGKLEWFVPTEINTEALEADVATLKSDVAELQGLVGKTSVADQISAAIAGLEGGAGGEANVIESINLGGNTLEVVDEVVTIPVGAGLKASNEVTIGEDGSLGVGTISFDKITNSANTIVVLDGGFAN